MDEQLFEEITTDEELELIERNLHNIRLDFPALTISSQCIYFNKLTESILPSYIKWFSTPTLIIGLPAEKTDKNAYGVKKYKEQRVCSTRLPSLMRAKKITKGSFKVYKYKNGFAFKRYEPVDDK